MALKVFKKAKKIIQKIFLYLKFCHLEQFFQQFLVLLLFFQTQNIHHQDKEYSLR